MPNAIDITLAHSPDADDAFMWWPLTGKVDARARDDRGVAPALTAPVLDTGRFRFLAVPADIEALNRRAVAQADLDITAMSMHTYPHAKGAYALTACGGSMGDGYGPKVVCRRADLPADPDAAGERLRTGDWSIAIPGARTTAFLTLSLMLGAGARVRPIEMPFDRIIPAVAAGEADAGLVIHDGQLTFADAGLALIADLGRWWKGHTGGLPLPLGANAVRRDLDSRYSPGAIPEVVTLLERSIAHALAHREESLAYALAFAPDARPDQVDTFVEMYVNDLTIDAGERGQAAIQRLLTEGARAGLCPDPGTIALIRGRR